MDKLDRRRRKRLLEIAPRFNEDVPTGLLLDQLPCIAAKSTREKIRNRARYEDAGDANSLLCSSLTGRTGWYEQLLKGLDAVGYERIAKMMKTDSKGNSLLSYRPSSVPTLSAVNSRRVPSPLHIDARHRNQRQYVRATPPSVPVERHISRNTGVIHLPVGVKKALSILDLPNDGGLSNNWEILADLLDVTWEESNWLERCSNPATSMISAWYEKHPDHATLGNLLKMLHRMNRPDVISEVRKVIGWEESGVADGSHSSAYRPVDDPEDFCHSLEKHPQYNLLGGDRSIFSMEEPRTTRSLPLDLKDQHQQLEKFQAESAWEGSSFRDGKQFSQKRNNQPLDPPGTSAMSSSLLDKSQKRQTNNQDFPAEKVADLSNKIQGALDPQDRLQLGYDFGKKGLYEGKVKGQKSEFTEKAKQDMPKEMNDMRLPATDKSLPSDWSKIRERKERSDLSGTFRECQENQNGQTECSNQTGEVFRNEPESGLVRRKPVNGFPRSNEAESGAVLEEPPQIPSPEETSNLNVESKKGKVEDNGPKTAESQTTSKIAYRGEISVRGKVCQAEDGQNDSETKNPACQPDDRTLNPNMMTADSRRGRESKNYILSQKKQISHRKKQILKELSLPSQMASVPAQNSFEETPVQYDISDSHAHSLVSLELESLNISASDILESLEEFLSDGEPAKLTTVVKVSCKKEKLEDGDRNEINCIPRLEEDKSPVAVKKVNKLPPPNVSQTVLQESLHHGAKTTDAKENVGVKNEGGEGTCNEQDGQKLGNDHQADKPKRKMEQGKNDGEGRVEMEHYNKGFHGESQGIHGDSQSIHGNSQGIPGDSQGIHGDGQSIHGNSQGIPGDSQSLHGDNKDRKNLEDRAEAMGWCSVESNSSKENGSITHDFTNCVFDSPHTEMGQGMNRPTVYTVGDKGINDLDQHGKVEQGSVSKNPQLKSKDITMFERKPLEDSRDEVKDDCLMEKEVIQQSYEAKEDKVGENDGAHILPSMSQSQEVGETTATPKPVRSQEPEEREVSAHITHWGNSLVTAMTGSVLRNLFGNNLSTL